MSLNFPSNPTTGQTTTQNGRTYTWSGYAWEFITQNVNSARSSLTTTSGTSTLSITGGYVPGYLDLFQNGVKLLSGSDYTATDGTSVTLANSAPSGTTIEYITLLPSINNNLYTKLDSISSSFNGSSTSFGLAVSGTAYYPVSANTLGIYVGGVAQEPISSYSVSGSNIVFTEAPASGLTFWGVGYGTTAVATLNGIVPGSVSSPAISSSNDLSTGFYFPSSGSINIASSGYDRFKIDYKGDILIGGQNINSLRYVDINNGNNSSSAGSILRLITINTSGTSNTSVDLVKYKNGQFGINNNETDLAAFTSFNVGNSERLRITSSGNIGIGTSVPTTLLDINNDKFRLRNSKTPSSATDTGNTGDICWDSSYIYVCTSTNNWTRTPISAWSSDPYFSYISLLLHMDGTGATFVDSSATPKTVTANGDATQSATQSKFGGKSAYFDGSGDYIQTPTYNISALQFSDQLHTVEFWFRTGSTQQYTCLFYRGRQGVSAAYDFVLNINNATASAGDIYLYSMNLGSPLGSSIGGLNDNNWHHLAVCRDSGNVLRMYIDGVQRASMIYNLTQSYSNNSDSIIRIGMDGALSGRDYNGYIDELRITTVCRYPNGTTFLVPTAAFPDYNT